MGRHSIMCIPRLAAALGKVSGIGKGEESLPSCFSVQRSKEKRKNTANASCEIMYS